jgi:hypothetical protein
MVNPKLSKSSELSVSGLTYGTDRYLNFLNSLNSLTFLTLSLSHLFLIHFFQKSFPVQIG